VIHYPGPGDYIDIHTHDSTESEGEVAVENLMAHEERSPSDHPGRLFTLGIHPWHLEPSSAEPMLEKVRALSESENVIALGEAGFDRLKGAAPDLQMSVFIEQSVISEKCGKPLFIHCVRAWDELLQAHRRLRPVQPWLVHGFRGKPELAKQLISRGMFLSFWFDFAIRDGSSALFRQLPRDRIFLETDGAPLSIRDLYKKVSADLEISGEALKERIYLNFNTLFNIHQ
jgi:TatD DNase family protein